jgi:dipeptidyl-peptidase-4
MKKLLLTLTIAAAFQMLSAQEITLDKIYSGYYRGKGIAGITSMKNGENYLVIEPTELQNILIKLLKKKEILLMEILKAMIFLMMNLKFYYKRKSTYLQTFFP